MKSRVASMSLVPPVGGVTLAGTATGAAEIHPTHKLHRPRGSSGFGISFRNDGRSASIETNSRASGPTGRFRSTFGHEEPIEGRHFGQVTPLTSALFPFSFPNIVFMVFNFSSVHFFSNGAVHIGPVGPRRRSVT